MQTESQPDIDIIQSAIELLRRHIDWDKALQRQSDLDGYIARADFGMIRQKPRKSCARKTIWISK